MCVRPSVCLYVNAALTEEPSNVIFCKHIHILPGSVIGTVIFSPEVNFGKYIIFCKVKEENLRKGKDPVIHSWSSMPLYRDPVLDVYVYIYKQTLKKSYKNIYFKKMVMFFNKLKGAVTF